MDTLRRWLSAAHLPGEGAWVAALAGFALGYGMRGRWPELDGIAWLLTGG